MATDAQPSTGNARSDNAARRRISLILSLLGPAACRPTSYFLNNPESPYFKSPETSSEVKPESRKKSFQRDRDELEELGIYVREQEAATNRQNEESSWAIDRSRTFADTHLKAEDIETLISAIDALLKRTDIPYAASLGRLRGKVLEVAFSRTIDPKEDIVILSDATATTPRIDPTQQSVWTAFTRRQPIKIKYRDNAGRESERVVSIYGIITMGGNCYFVGHDSKSDQIRTFRTDRVSKSPRLNEQRKSWNAYSIPDDFNIEDYVFLPFEIAPGESMKLSFTLPGGIPKQEIEKATRGRGQISRMSSEQEGECWRWDVMASNLNTVVSFALKHADMGMRPLAPVELRRAWNEAIGKAAASHGNC